VIGCWSPSLTGCPRPTDTDGRESFPALMPNTRGVELALARRHVAQEEGRRTTAGHRIAVGTNSKTPSTAQNPAIPGATRSPIARCVRGVSFREERPSLALALAVRARCCRASVADAQSGFRSALLCLPEVGDDGSSMHSVTAEYRGLFTPAANRPRGRNRRGPACLPWPHHRLRRNALVAVMGDLP
jgi:hypothetical protein